MMLLACYDMWKYRLKDGWGDATHKTGCSDKTVCYRAPVSTGMRKTTGFKKGRRIFFFLNFIITMKLSTVGEVSEKSSGEILVLYQGLKVYASVLSYLQGP